MVSSLVVWCSIDFPCGSGSNLESSPSVQPTCISGILIYQQSPRGTCCMYKNWIEMLTRFLHLWTCCNQFQVQFYEFHVPGCRCQECTSDVQVDNDIRNPSTFTMLSVKRKAEKNNPLALALVQLKCFFKATFAEWKLCWHQAAQMWYRYNVTCLTPNNMPNLVLPELILSSIFRL